MVEGKVSRFIPRNPKVLLACIIATSAVDSVVGTIANKKSYALLIRV